MTDMSITMAESTDRTSATSTDEGSTLPLVRRQIRIFPKMDRRMKLVDSHLEKVFWSLVNGQAPWPLFLHGPVGAGKTLAALSLCDICRTAAYETVEGLSDRRPCRA